MRAIELILSPEGNLKSIYHRLATAENTLRFAGYSSRVTQYPSGGCRGGQVLCKRLKFYAAPAT